MSVDLRRWDDVRLFLAAARAGSFSAAARSEGIEQSTISRRVASLEQQLGAPVFARTPSGPVLTALGQRLFAHAERVEAEVHGFTDEASGHEREVEGLVRIALTETMAAHVVIPEVLPALRASYPGLEIELMVSYESVDLLHREADIALRFFRPQRGDLVAKRAVAFETGVLATRSYAHRKRRRPQSFEWIGLRLPGIPAPASEWAEAELGVTPRLWTNSYHAQVEMVRAGLGVAVLTTTLRRVDPELLVLDLGLAPTPPVELWLSAHRAVRPVPRVAAVWAKLDEVLAQIS